MNNELNHCSKCRSVILRMKHIMFLNTRSYYVVCGNCGKTTKTFDDTKEEAIQNWNKKNWGLTNAEKNYWFT